MGEGKVGSLTHLRLPLRRVFIEDAYGSEAGGGGHLQALGDVFEDYGGRRRDVKPAGRSLVDVGEALGSSDVAAVEASSRLT